MLGSVDGAEEVNDGWARTPVVDIDFVVHLQEEGAIENDVGGGTFFVSTLANDVEGLELSLEPSCIFGYKCVTDS